MSWGCKQKPNGCGWANRLNYTTGEETWWCDLCERSGWIRAASQPEPSYASVTETEQNAPSAHDGETS